MPPCATPSAGVKERELRVVVPVMASVVPVALRKSKSVRCEVELAVNPLVSCRSVVVAEGLRPNCVCWVKGHANVAYVLVSIERVPSLPDVFTKPLEVRLPNFVRYALTALIAVEEAYAI